MFRRYLGASFIAAVSVLSYLSSLSLIASVQDKRTRIAHVQPVAEAPSAFLGGAVGVPSGEHRRKLVRRSVAHKAAKAEKSHHPRHKKQSKHRR